VILTRKIITKQEGREVVFVTVVQRIRSKSLSKHVRRGRSREERNVFWGLIGAGARTGWRLRHGENDRGTTTGRFINKHVKGIIKKVKHNLEGADIVRDMKRAARRKRK
jgi:hypothetical protein